MSLISLKPELCKAFCDGISIREVPAGLAVGTPLSGVGGDPVGFYVVDTHDGAFRIEDSGIIIPFIEADGVALDGENRAQVLAELLREYDAAIDERTRELYLLARSLDEVPAAALKFFALLLRIQDLMFLSVERVANTFKEDAIAAIRQEIGGRAEIKEGESIAAQLEDYPADICIFPPAGMPTAVYLASSDARIYEAVLVQTMAEHEFKVPCRIIALADEDSHISAKMRRRASNRLDAMTYFRGDERAAVDRIARVALGNESVFH